MNGGVDSGTAAEIAAQALAAIDRLTGARPLTDDCALLVARIL
jgi:hypothetical protein